MDKKILYLISIGLLVSCNDNYILKGLIINGNDAHLKREFENSITYYKKALAISKEDSIANFNISNSFYYLKQYQEAAQYAQLADSLSSHDLFKAQATYNEGNAYLKKENYEKAVEVYKKSLRLNPFDKEAQYNYSLALEKIKQKDKDDKKDNQQNNQNNQNNPQNQPQQNQNQQNNQNQQQKNQNNPNQQQKPNPNNQQKPNQNNQNSNQNQNQQQAKSRMTDEQVEGLLRQLENEERRIQRERIDSKKQGFPQQNLEKDW